MKPATKRQNPIVKKQITIIKMALNHLQIDDDTYRDMLDSRFSVRSCTLLSCDQASEFIKELEGKGFVLIQKTTVRKQATGASRWRPRPASRPAIPRTGNVIALATREELEKIVAVADLIAWRVENGLQLFLEKRMGIKGGRVRTSGDAYLAIEGLKKMFENQMKRYHGADWWRTCRAKTSEMPDGVLAYIAEHCPAEYR